jgi:hypothetical protein
LRLTLNSFQYVNPYIAGSPVTGTEMFFGREDVFSFVRRNLIGRHRDTPIVLYGQRRTGKTSVLCQLHRHLDPSYLCIFIDLHGLSLDGMSNLLLGIANSISRGLQRDHQFSVRIPDRALFLADPRAAFETMLLEAVWPVLGENHLVLLMDEVVRLEEEVKAGRLEREIFEYLRHLMQHYARMNFIFSVGSGVEEMEKDYAFLFSVSLYHRISFLEPAAARELITKPVRGHYHVTPEAVTKILQITSGHPYYTQLVCHCIFDRWMRFPKPEMTMEDVSTVLAEAIELGSANLKYVWEDSTPGEQALMAGMSAAMRTASGPVTVNDIREAWSDVGVSLPEREVARAVRSLSGREVVAGERSYSFAVDLQRLWLDKHRRLDWVKEELAQTLQEWDQLAEAEPSTTITDRSADLRQSRFPQPPKFRTTLTLVAAALVGLGVAVWYVTSLLQGRPGPSPEPVASTASPPSASPATPAPRPTASGGRSVAIGPRAAHQAGAGQIAMFLARYFAAINDRDYQAYANLFAKQNQPSDGEQGFLAGYSSTTDSNATLVALSRTAAGGRAATVIFDSHQAPDISVTHTACTRWDITLDLEPYGTTFLIGPAPHGYKPSSRPCP